MATALLGGITARSATPIPLYTTTTDGQGKTVFTGVSSPFTVVLPLASTINNANLSYNASTGVYSCDAGVTYQLFAEGTISNYSSATPAKLQWVNAATGATLGPAMPITENGGVVIAPSKSGSAITVALTVIPGSSPFDYPAQLNTSMRTYVQVISGWVE